MSIKVDLDQLCQRLKDRALAEDAQLIDLIEATKAMTAAANVLLRHKTDDESTGATMADFQKAIEPEKAKRKIRVTTANNRSFDPNKNHNGPWERERNQQ